MRVVYGGYAFDDHAVTPIITKRAIEDAMGFKRAIHERWILAGELHAESQSALKSAIQAMEAAFSVNGLDLKLLHNDGTTDSAHAIYSDNTVGGVRVVDLSYPQGDGAEYSTFRSFQITLEAEMPISGVQNVMQWQETVQTQGGGELAVWKTDLNGVSQKQVVKPATTYRVVQSGTAIGHLAYPPFPLPIDPDNVHWNQSSTVYRNPERTNDGTFIRWPISWTYVMENSQNITRAPGLGV